MKWRAQIRPRLSIEVFATPSPRLIPEGEKTESFTVLALAPNEGSTAKGLRMSMPRRLVDRPDFEADEKGVWLDPDYLPLKLKNKLWELLPKRMPYEQRSHFLSLVGESLQMASRFHISTAAAEQLKQLQHIQGRARALLQAIAQLSPETRATLRSHSYALALGGSPLAQLSDIGAGVASGREAELLGYFWDAAQDVEKAAAYAASNVAPAKTERPTQLNAKRLTAFVVKNFYAVQGQLPPCSKGTWFPTFMSELGQAENYSIRIALVMAVFEDIKASGVCPVPAGGKQTPTRVFAFFKGPEK